MAQDMPPVGGYEPVQWKRNLPSRGFRPKIWLGGMLAICAYGFYKSYQAIYERRELKREKVWARIYLQPLLQAEVDRDTVRRHYSELAREKEVMKNVKGWVPKESVYNDGRFHYPTFYPLTK